MVQFGMVGTIAKAITMTKHSIKEPLEIQTLKRCIPMCLVFQPPLYLKYETKILKILDSVFLCTRESVIIFRFYIIFVMMLRGLMLV